MDVKVISLDVNASNIAPWLVFILVFLFYTYPMGLSDYWWHINTGRLIWDSLSIPGIDYFTYTVPQDDNVRRTVILKAYYIGQIFFYFIYSSFGIWGLLLFKASLLTFSLWLLWRYLLYKNVDSIIATLLIIPLPIILFRFDELRPVIFSFVGSVLVLF